MANYVFIYSGGGMPEGEEAQKAEMAAWGAWYGEIGEKLADGGNPFSVAKTVTAGDVSDGGKSALTGYTVVTTDTIGEAVELAKGCPNNKHGGTVEVYETFQVM